MINEVPVAPIIFAEGAITQMHKPWDQMGQQDIPKIRGLSVSYYLHQIAFYQGRSQFIF